MEYEKIGKPFHEMKPDEESLKVLNAKPLSFLSRPEPETVNAVVKSCNFVPTQLDKISEKSSEYRNSNLSKLSKS